MIELFIYVCVGLSVTIFVWLLVNLYNSFDFSKISAGEEKDRFEGRWIGNVAFM